MRRIYLFLVALFVSITFVNAGNYYDSIPEQCVNVTGGSLILSHTNAQYGATSNGTLKVDFFGDLDLTTEFVDVLSENGTLIATLSTASQCGQEQQIVALDKDSINAWALDGTISFTYQASASVNSGICTGLSGAAAFCVVPVLSYTFQQGVDNIGVLSMDAPSPGTCAGNTPITITVGNFGTNQVDTFSVAWEINGITQTPQTYYTLLDTNGGANPTTTQITLNPSYNFTASTTFKFWTYSPNNLPDTINQNDTLQKPLAPALAGVYTIGSGGNYINFTSAVNDLVALGVCAPVTFNVLTGSGPFNEQIVIPQVVGASAINTITFNGNGETITYATTGTADNYIIRLDGADHVTFDSLMVQTQSTTNNFAIQLINNADSNTINNCVVDLTSALTSTSSTNAGIVVSGSLTGATTAGASGAYNTITNNHIIGGYYGLTINGASSTSESMNNVVDSNRIEDFYFYGTYLRSISNSSISFNDISRPNRTSVSTFYGLYFITSGESNTIEGNRLHDPFRGLGGVSTSAAYPIYYSSVDATTGNENRVINNLIYNMNSNGTIYALYNIGSDGVYYFHNTISLDDQNSTGGTTRGFYQTTTASNIEFVNNIVTVTRSGGGALYCLYFNATGSAIVSNNNVLYTPITINNTGYFGGNQNTLADWQTATTGDANSVDAQPLYVNPTANDFAPSSPLVDGIADPSANVLTDIFGVTRALTPDPGAIEFTPPSCPQPSNLIAINVTGSSADLSWLETGSATTWQIDWDTAGVAQGFGNLVVTTNNPYTLTGLSPQSEYRYYVRSICAVGDTSLWGGPYSLTTLCAPATAPWIDSVETHLTTTNSTIENCWSSSPSNTTSTYRWNIDGAGSTPSSSTGPSGAYSGNNYFYTEASNGSAGDVAELYTPLIDVSALTLPELSFYYHMYGQTMGDLYIDVFDGVNWITTDSIKGEQQTADTDPWLQHEIVLNNFPDTIQVRFRSIRSTNFYGDMSLDDIEIKEAPTCPEPIALYVTSLTTNSATFGWTEVGSANNWQVEWGISGFALGGGVRLMTTTNPHTQLGLQAAVSYDFYVRSVCTPGDSSLWTGPYTFTTPICNPSQQCNYTFRMTDSYGDGWNGNTMDIIQNGITVATIGGTFTNGNGPVNVNIPLCSNFPFDLFWNTGGSFATEVGIEIIDANNTSIFTHNPGTDLSGSTLYTDSVFCPSCPVATSLSDSAVSATSVDLSWAVNSTATSWQVEWDTIGFIQGTGNIAVTSNNPYNISGLTPTGIYQFYVRDICSVGDTSNWSGPHTFTTPCASFVAPWLDDVEIHTPTTNSTIENCWSSFPTGTTADYRWDIDGSGSTPSSSTGPSGAFSGNNYFYIEASSGSQGDVAELYSPLIDVSSLSTPELEFYYHMYGATMGNLYIDVNNGTNWVTVDSIMGQQQTAMTDSWLKRNVILLGMPNIIQIRFRSIKTGTSFTADMSLDDIRVIEATTCTPQIVNLGNDTTICGTDSVILNAGTNHFNYFWSDATGSSSPTLVVDSTTFGMGVHNISVAVVDSTNSCVSRDTIVVEITTCVGIEDLVSTVDLNVYPNPNKGQFTLNLTTTNTTDLQIRITNIQGQEVFVKNNFDNINNVINEEINIGNVKGVYFVNIITNNEVITKKIIVQ